VDGPKNKAFSSLIVFGFYGKAFQTLANEPDENVWQQTQVFNGRYADDRHLWKARDLEILPAKESIKYTDNFYNGKIHYGLLVRFLRGQIGNDWDAVYAEIINRIPTKLLDYRKMVFWFVAKNVEIVDNKLWDEETQKFIWTGKVDAQETFKKQWLSHVFYEFYVDPTNNLLQHIQQKAYKNLL
jgi:hypothetical protein